LNEQPDRPETPSLLNQPQARQDQKEGKVVRPSLSPLAGRFSFFLSIADRTRSPFHSASSSSTDATETQTPQKHSRQQLLGHSAGHLKQRRRGNKKKKQICKERSRSEKGEGREADLKTKKEKRKQTCLLRFWVFAGNGVAHSRQEG
jgi:hypothetical protein